MSDLESRVKALEAKVKLLEETLETLKNMQMSEQMGSYLQSKTKTLKMVDLINAVSEKPDLDFRQEEASVANIQKEKQKIDSRITAALKNAGDFSEQYPDDPRYFCYEVESGITSKDWRGKSVRNDQLLKYVGWGLRITSYNGFESERVIVPAEIDGKPVISIGPKAFQNASVKEVFLPKTLKAILDYAFAGCVNLKHINLPSELHYLGERCFYKSGIESIKIPDAVKTLPFCCFSDCHYLSAVSLGSVQTVGRSVFQYCSALNELLLPETVCSLGSECLGGTEVKVLIVPSGVKSFQPDIFRNSGSGYTNEVTCVFLGKDTRIEAGYLLNIGLIYCLPGSNVQKVAREQSIPIKPLSEFRME